MKILSRTLMSLSLLGCLYGLSAASWAQSEPQEPPPRQDAPLPRNPASLSDSVRRAQRETGGQVLGAERIQYDGREINRVKVMDDRGRVRFMDDDPQRGRGNNESRDRGDRFDRGRDAQRPDAPPPARGGNPRRP